MKIVFDKLSGDAVYNITPKEIKALFSIVPELTSFIKLVHVQGQRPGRSVFSRPVRYEGMSHKLNISAKGMSREEIAREVFVELIASNSRDYSLRPAKSRRLSKQQQSRIDVMVLPLMDQFKVAIDVEKI